MSSSVVPAVLWMWTKASMCSPCLAQRIDRRREPVLEHRRRLIDVEHPLPERTAPGRQLTGVRPIAGAPLHRRGNPVDIALVDEQARFAVTNKFGNPRQPRGDDREAHRERLD